VPAETISKKLSALTPGFSGADIANACNEAALVAARAGKKAIELEDFEKAIERIIGGLEKKERVLSPKEKERVAWHEAGHAIAGWFLRHADPLLKVSIIPRGSAALGYAQVQPHEQYLYTSEQIQDRICMTLAGRAAEEIVYGVVSSGARDDLERVASYIYAQITKYGMNELVGPLSFRDPEESGETEKTYSQTTAELIDQEARRIAKEAYQRTLALLREKHEQLTAVATRLLEREVLSREDMIELVGARPFPERVSYDGTVTPPPRSSLSRSSYLHALDEQISFLHQRVRDRARPKMSPPARSHHHRLRRHLADQREREYSHTGTHAHSLQQYTINRSTLFGCR